MSSSQCCRWSGSVFSAEHRPCIPMQEGAGPKAAFALLKTPYKNKAVPHSPGKGTRLQTAGRNELLDVMWYRK